MRSSALCRFIFAWSDSRRTEQSSSIILRRRRSKVSHSHHDSVRFPFFGRFGSHFEDSHSRICGCEVSRSLLHTYCPVWGQSSMRSLAWVLRAERTTPCIGFAYLLGLFFRLVFFFCVTLRYTSIRRWYKQGPVSDASFYNGHAGSCSTPMMARRTSFRRPLLRLS